MFRDSYCGSELGKREWNHYCWVDDPVSNLIYLARVVAVSKEA